MISLTPRLLYPWAKALPVPIEYNTSSAPRVSLNTWKERLLFLPAVEPLLLSLPALRLLTQLTTLPRPLHPILRLRMRTLWCAIPTVAFTGSCVEQCFSTFVRPRPGKFFFHKTKARSQQIYS